MVALSTPIPADGRRTRPAPWSVGRLVMIATLAGAGVVHLALAPEHLDGALLLGVGFVAVGILQIVLTVALLQAVTRARLMLALAVSVASLLALISAVTVGLPILAHGEAMGMLGPVEGLDDLAAITGLFEGVTAFVTWRWLRSPRPEHRTV